MAQDSTPAAAWSRYDPHNEISNVGSLKGCLTCADLILLGTRAELFEHAWATQTAVATAGLMLTSAALGFSARSLLDALTGRQEESEQGSVEREVRERVVPTASRPADEDIWHMPGYAQIEFEERQTGQIGSGRLAQHRQSTPPAAMAWEGSALQAGGAAVTEASCPKPEQLWEAAWRSLEAKPTRRAQQSGARGSSAAGWWQLLRFGNRQVSGQRRCSP